MIFKPEQLKLVELILNSYINKEENVLAREQKNQELIANKGKDPILYDVFTDSIHNNIHIAEKMKEIFSSLEKKDDEYFVKGENSTFSVLAGGFDGPISAEQKKRYESCWDEACKVFFHETADKKARLDKSLFESGLKDVEGQYKEASNRLTKQIHKSMELGAFVGIFISQETNNPKIKLK